jgi:hypothetical protein
MELNPDLAFLEDVKAQYARMGSIWGGERDPDPDSLESIGGGFSITLETLQDTAKRALITAKIRQCADCADEVVRIISENIAYIEKGRGSQMKKMVLWGLILCALLSATIARAEEAIAPVDLVGLLSGATRGLSVDQVKEQYGAPAAEAPTQLVYEDTENRLSVTYHFEEGALSALTAEVAYPEGAADQMYVAFLYYQAQLIAYLDLSPSFTSYVQYSDLAEAREQFDGGMYGWFGVNGGELYVGATFDTGDPVLYLTCSGLAE